MVEAGEATAGSSARSRGRGPNMGFPGSQIGISHSPAAAVGCCRIALEGARLQETDGGGSSEGLFAGLSQSRAKAVSVFGGGCAVVGGHCIDPDNHQYERNRKL